MKQKYETVLATANNVENALYSAYKVSESYKYDDNMRVRYIAVTVGNALSWYIRTARANTDFLKAFVNLSDCRMKNLFKKCIKADTGTEVEAIKAIKAYLKVK
jgi:hypothetical protein